MGKWDRRYRPRPRRRDYQDYQWSPPRDEPCPDPETEEWQDNVPMWEKKFCYLVGRMPWKKVLRTKNIMHCNGNILSWDDSAGKEAFDDAKKRFWEEINGLSSASELPNPDSYIDQIDWNPYIDPELVRDVDRTFFNPDDKYFLPTEHSLKVNNGLPDDDSNPWERAQQKTSASKDKATVWNEWDSSPDDKNHQEPRSALDSVVRDKSTGWNLPDNRANDGETGNPWECGKSTGWKQWDTSVNTTGNLNGNDSPWCGRTEDCKVVTDSSWGGTGRSSWDVKPWNQWQDRVPGSRNLNQNRKFQNPNNPNNNYRPHDYGSRQGQAGRGPRGRGNSWGQSRWHNSNNSSWEAKESGNTARGGGHFDGACRKREGPDVYVASHKGPRLQGGNSHSFRYQNRGNNDRVAFGGQWN